MIKIKSMIKIKKRSRPMGFRDKKHEIRFEGTLSLWERVRVMASHNPLSPWRSITELSNINA
jgi:hypothetical protein